MRFICTFFYLLFVSLVCKSQHLQDSCNLVADGYIVVVTEGSDKQVLTSSLDYVFFENLPVIELFDTPKDLIGKGARFFSRSYLSTYNLKRFTIEGMSEFDSSEEPFSVVSGERFYFEVYRALVVYRQNEVLMSDYLNHESLPHKHSFFSTVSTNDEEILIMNPTVVRVW